jgi:excisionase family DNA binding protein
MNKRQAAERLGLSEKTVERYKSSGKLSARLKHIVGADGKSRKVLDFNQSDLERLKRELSNDIVFPMVTEGHAQTKTQTDIDRQTQLDNLNVENEESLILRQTQTVTLISAIFSHLESVSKQYLEASDRAQKLVLTIPEASAVSGLPKSYIRQNIKDGKLKAKIIGRGYKVKRQELDEFINNL